MIILRDITLECEGYYPEQLKPKSNKYIWVSCVICNDNLRIKMCKYTGHNAHAKCYQQHRKADKQAFLLRMKNGLLSKYGVDHNSKIPGTIKKREQTWLRKIGVNNPSKSNSIKRKKRETCRLHYGVDSPLQNKEVLKSQIRTTRKRYGVNRPAQNAQIKEKMQKTCRSRYGFNNPLQNKEIANRVSRTRKKGINEDQSGKYILINTLRDKTGKFWSYLKDGFSLTEICKELNLNYNTLRSTMVLPEFREKYEYLYSFPKCQMQNIIRKIIEEMTGEKAVINTRKIIPPLELDIYFPTHKIAIEYNGNAYHSNLFSSDKDIKLRHYKKLVKCREKDIKVINIFENIWKSRSKQVLSFLRSKFKLNETRIVARDCVITNSSAKDFIESYHIQGNRNGVIRYFNLVYNNDIIGSIAAHRHIRKNDNKTIVLDRLCFKEDYFVIGGANKLFAAFKKWAIESDYTNIISWSDNCWTEGDIYQTLGFKFEKELEPEHFYWDKKRNKYISNQSLNRLVKSRPKSITRIDWCLMNGYYRIYDCGKKRWTFPLNATSKVENINIKELLKLKDIFARIASPDTAYDPDTYEANKHKSALYGHCGCVAHILREVLGGSILVGKIDNTTHLWNLFPNGEEVDLTSCQFGGDGSSPIIKGRIYNKELGNNHRITLFKNKFEKEKGV